MVGVLECCKLELYRKLAAPYEDTKEMESGPVYDSQAARLMQRLTEEAND